jgi:hypothetical protein
MLIRLCQKAEELGYEYAFDFIKRCEECPVGHKKSAHKVGLACDLHLYRDKEYLSDGSGHRELHDYWDILGGAARIDNDLNHYSCEYEGVR